MKSGGKKVFHLGERCKTYKKVGALGNIDMRLDIRDAPPPKKTKKNGKMWEFFPIWGPPIRFLEKPPAGNGKTLVLEIGLRKNRLVTVSGCVSCQFCEK